MTTSDTTTNNNSQSSDSPNGYPIFPDVPSDRPWLASYEDYNIDSNIPMPDNDGSLLEAFERNFEKFGSRDAYICMGKAITFRELDIYSRQIATYLQSLGLKKGDKVAVMMPNVLQYPIVMLGVVRAGMVLVNVNPLYNSRELEHQLHDCGAKAIFLIENFAKTFEDVEDKGNIEHIVMCSVGDMLGTVKGFVINSVLRYIKRAIPKYSLPNSVHFNDAMDSVSAHQYQRPTLNLSDVALLQYTGGTTGVSKGAMLSHGNLIANMLQIDNVISATFGEHDGNEIMLTALPLYHVFSFMVCGIFTMHRGFTGLLIPNPRDLDSLVKEIGKYKPAFLPSVNTLFNALVNHEGFVNLDFSNLKASIGGGMSVMPKVAKEWHEVTGKPIVEGYGLSETSPVVSFNPINISEYTGTIGLPVPSTDVILLDDDGNVAPLGERGEICVKGPQVMVGYHNKPEENESTFTKEGYLKTGDIGVINEDGFIKIVDRKKDMILVSGFNVYPNEIEEAIVEHPAVLEVGAIGVPSDERGEEPKIFVVKKQGADVDEKELIKFGKKQLTGYKRPRHVQFVDELPKSNVGKILRKELREWQEEQSEG